MARKFEFNKSRTRLELEIAGEQFEVDVMDPLWLKRFEQKKTEILKSGDELSEFSKSEDRDVDGYEKLLNKAIAICVETVDALLEEGATKRIFKDAPIKFLDIVDVVHFIFSETDEYLQKDVVNKFSANRAQRRAKK